MAAIMGSPEGAAQGADDGLVGLGAEQLAVELANVTRPQVDCLVWREMTTAVEPRPPDDVPVIALREPPDAAEVAGEGGQAERDRGRLGRTAGVRVLVVEPGSRGGRLGEP